MRIITAPHPVLSEIAKSVGIIDKELLSLLEEMKKTLLATRDPQGVGLAAPQVGKSLRIFITKPTDKSAIQVFINPVLVEESEMPQIKKKTKGAKLEGCLSLPTIWGIVARKPKLTLTYQDEHGKSHTKKFSGFMATIIQHEMDHLDGILFPKRVLEQKQRLFKSHKDKKGEDIFDEIEI